MSLGGKSGGQQINCHGYTQQKPLFGHTDSSEPEPGAISCPHWHSGNMLRLKLSPEVRG